MEKEKEEGTPQPPLKGEAVDIVDTSMSNWHSREECEFTSVARLQQMLKEEHLLLTT
jgi:hypothetical protein